MLYYHHYTFFSEQLKVRLHQEQNIQWKYYINVLKLHKVYNTIVLYQINTDIMGTFSTVKPIENSYKSVSRTQWSIYNKAFM